MAALADGDGMSLRTSSFTPTKPGNWEVVAFGEEGDYYLVLALSSRSPSGRDESVPAFKQLIRSHHAASAQEPKP